jgi:hypothetical protein
LVAQGFVSDQRRLDAQHSAVGKGWRDADVLHIQQEADRHIQQESVLLHDREHSSLGICDVFEVQVHADHQTASADVCDQQWIFALELPQLLLKSPPERGHLPHQTFVVLGHFVDRRQCGAACKRVSRECGPVPQVEVFRVHRLLVKTGADRHESAAERFGKREDVGCHSFRFAGEQGARPSKTGLHFVNDEQCAKAVTQLRRLRQIALGRDMDS